MSVDEDSRREDALDDLLVARDDVARGEQPMVEQRGRDGTPPR